VKRSPLLGEHTDEILKDVLRYSAKEIADIEGKAVSFMAKYNYGLAGNSSHIHNSLWSADGKTCTMTEQPFVDAMTFIHKAIFTDKSIPGPGVAADFFAGDAAMTITQISRAALLPKENGFAWDLVPLPEGPAGKYAVIGQAGIGVFASGKNVQAAADFLAFFTNPENSKKLAQYFPPARASLLNVDVLSAANPLLSPAQIDSVVVHGISTGKVKPGHAGFAEIQQTIRASLDALWVPDADVAAVLKSACDRVQPLLAQ